MSCPRCRLYLAGLTHDRLRVLAQDEHNAAMHNAQPGALVCSWLSVDGYGCNFRAGHVGWHERHRAPGIPAPDLYR